MKSLSFWLTAFSRTIMHEFNWHEMLNRMVRGTLRRICLYLHTKRTLPGSIPSFCFSSSILSHLFINNFSPDSLRHMWCVCVHSVASQCTAQVGCSDQNEARSIRASAWSWPFKFLTNQKVVFRILITNLLIFQISLFSSCNFQFIIHSESSFSEGRITFSVRWLVF